MTYTHFRKTGVVLASMTAVAGLALAPTASASSTTWTTRLVPTASCGAATPGHATCFALHLVKVRVKSGSSQAKAGVAAASAAVTPGLAAGPAGGFTPGDIATAYGANPASTNGSKQTVAIVDANKDPSVATDLATFDTQYSLPAETATSFRVLNQAGGTDLSAVKTDVGWAGEISLDVQTVRGLCHLCKIVLIEANTSAFPDLEAAENTAAGLAGEISNSYGGPESGTPGPSDLAAYDHQGKVITVSTGDDGWYGWDFIDDTPHDPSQSAAQFPSTFNTVVAVGGTTLQLNDNGTRANEAVWNDNGPKDVYGFNLGRLGATGGGCSQFIDTRRWQQFVAGYAGLGCASDPGTKVPLRAAADVAAVADPFTGYDVNQTTAWCAQGGTDGNGHTCPNASPGWQTFGGTSLAAPVVASLWALAGGAGGQKYPALSLYGHFKSAPSTLYDVTFGGNGACDYASAANCAGFFGGNPNLIGLGAVDCAFSPFSATNKYQCYARTGFDGPSGVGTPKGAAPFLPLNPTAAFTHSPTTVTHGATQTFTSHSTDPYPGGTLVTFAWVWGDGTHTTTSAASTTHKFTTAGTRTVKLTVTDIYGRSASKSLTLTVH